MPETREQNKALQLACIKPPGIVFFLLFCRLNHFHDFSYLLLLNHKYLRPDKTVILVIQFGLSMWCSCWLRGPFVTFIKHTITTSCNKLLTTSPHSSRYWSIISREGTPLLCKLFSANFLGKSCPLWPGGLPP